MMRKLAAVLFYLCATVSAFAQIQPGSGVIQNGAVTPNNCVAWVGNGQIKDAGTTCGSGSAITALTGDVTATGPGSAAATLATTQAAAHTWSAANTFSANGASALPGVSLTGTWLANANVAQFLVQPSAASAFAGSANGTGLGVNAASGFTGNLFDLQLNGSSVLTVTTAGVVTASSSLQAGANAFLRIGTRFSLSSPTNGTLVLGLTDAAAPVAAIVRTQSVIAGTSNTAGVNTTFQGSVSTGSAASGDIIFTTGGTGASATVQNTQITALTIKAGTTNNTTVGQPSVVLGAAAIATNATDGFLYVASGAGTPTGTPTTFTGRVAMYLDTTNSQLWFFMGGAWKQPKTPAGAAIVTWQ